MSYIKDRCFDDNNINNRSLTFEWILNDDDLKKAAKEVFGSCKNLLGAAVGYVSLRDEEGTHNRVIYLDSGVEACTVDNTLPVPIRGLSAQAYRTGKPVFENNFAASPSERLLPQGHIRLNNVLFAPLVIKDQIIGLIGLANKEGGFSDFDASVASAFGRLAAVTLNNFNINQALRNSEEKFRVFFSGAYDVVTLTQISDEGLPMSFLEVNDTAINKFGYSRYQFLSMTWADMVSPEEKVKFENISRQLQVTKKVQYEATMLAKDGRKIHLECCCQLLTLNGKKVVLTIARDISVCKRHLQAVTAINKKLRASNRELDRVSRLKSDFLANMSHELKTPLTAIFLLTDELLSGTIGNLGPIQDEYLRDIRLSADQLLRMFNDLLELPKIESGRVSLDLKHINIDIVIFNVVKRLSPLARRREIKVKCIFQAANTIIADTTKVDQVVSNLLSNAIKFSPRGNNVVVSVSDYVNPEQGVIIKVTDYGTGIAEDKRSMVFESFYQIDKGLDKDFHGVGLGLALVRKIVDLHTGWVKLDSATDVGSTFTVFLPSYPSFANDLN